MAGLALGLAGGAAAGLVVTFPGISGAVGAVVQQESEPDSTVPDTTAPDSDSTGRGREQARADAAERIRERLQDLVDDGTLTAEQADAVAEHLATSTRSGHGGREWGRGAHVFGRGFGDALDDLLGVDMRDLFEQLRDGATIADIAEAHDVDLQSVIDELVGGAQEWLDRAVEHGRLTEDEVASKLAEIRTRIEDFVNDGGGWFTHRGADPRPDAPADDAPDTTTAD